MKKSSVGNGAPAKSAPSKTARTAASREVTGRPSRGERAVPGKSTKTSGSASAKANQSAPPLPAAAPEPPANGKPRKNQAGLSARDLDHFRELLLAKRRELIGDMSAMEREALRSSGATNLSNLPIHMADMGTDNYEQEFTLGLVQKDRDLLKEINLALAKIQNGTYGLCEGTGLPIIKERLEFQPWVRYSVEHQRKMERHGR